MTDWIEHNGGPQPVADDVWLSVELRNGRRIHAVRTGSLRPTNRAWPVDIVRYRILNQQLIDAKQAEIDALKEELETWQSVFPHIIPDRLQGQEDLGKEFTAIWDANTNALHEAGESDISNLIDAARLEGIRLGLEAADKAVGTLRAYDDLSREIALEDAGMAIRALDPETIAREAADKETAR